MPPSEIKQLAAALVAAQSEMPAVTKGGFNNFDKYPYAKLEDYVKVVKPIFAKHSLSTITSVDSVERLPDRQTKNGVAEHVAQVKITLLIMHNSGESLSVTSFGEGQDRSDKAIYKAITGARKYALASALALATTDDPEEDAPPPPTRATPARNGTNGTVNGTGHDAKRELIVKVQKWTGFQTEDVPAAIGKIKAALDIRGDASPEQVQDMHKFVDANAAKKFQEVLA